MLSHGAPSHGPSIPDIIDGSKQH
ncbi:hypothetical protein A2U01_0078959, partial [Trifolium medium]|nr:hypothetical protein [Trifolium medium]